MLSEHIHWKDNGTGSLQVRVTPKASTNRVRIEDRTEGPFVRVDVTVAPEDGKANKQVIKLLAKRARIAQIKPCDYSRPYESR